MYLESVTLSNFQCFGPEPTVMRMDEQLTAMIGPNAAGKTALCQALLRIFSVIPEQRRVRLEDFHVPESEDEVPHSRALSVEAVFAFPELKAESQGAGSVPEFFAQMSADDEGELKLRVRLEATWTDEGPVDGTIDDSRRLVHTFDAEYGDRWMELRGSDRNRIQMVYVPATRHGARQVGEFLRGRVWSACQWSESFQEHVGQAADALAEKFKTEAVVDSVTSAIANRWQQLHHLKADRVPYFEPISREVSALVTSAEMMFEPSPTGRNRPARELSDGQQSLLHIALTAATLDLEAAIAAGDHAGHFDLQASALPSLTLLAIEEPENNLSPFELPPL